MRLYYYYYLGTSGIFDIALTSPGLLFRDQFNFILGKQVYPPYFFWEQIFIHPVGSGALSPGKGEHSVQVASVQQVALKANEIFFFSSVLLVHIFVLIK